MARNITVGIDVGTYQIKVVVAEVDKSAERSEPTIIGSGFAESRGLRHGYIINVNEAEKSIRQAVAQAEKMSGVKIRKAYLGVGGIGLSSVVSQASTIISRADLEITELDMKKVLDTAEHDIPPALAQNRKIIHAIPIQYRLDGKIVHGRPLGMRGTKLEVKALFISCLSQHLQDLVETIEELGITVVDAMASPLAASLVTLTKAQKIAGCVLANVGAETISIAVFENNIPISLEVFPIGGTDITHDIALGLKVPLEEAEQIKLGAITTTSYPRKKLEDIVHARLSDIFELIEAHLKKIGKSGLLPAGIIITGGASHMGVVEEFGKELLRLPSKIGQIRFGGSLKEQNRDNSFVVAYGLCILGFTAEKDDALAGMRIDKETTGRIISWIKQFLP